MDEIAGSLYEKRSVRTRDGGGRFQTDKKVSI